MRVLVCGSRHYKDWEFLFKYLDGFHRETPITTLIEGEARGADEFARQWSWKHGIPVDRYPADWNKHGKAAGPIRNKQMLDEGKPDLVIAFLAPNSRGTKNMIEQAEKAGIPVKVVNIA